MYSFKLTVLGVLCAAGCYTVQGASPVTNNVVSRLCSLTDTRMLADFEQSTDGFEAAANVTALTPVKEVPNGPHRVHSGSYALQVDCNAVAAHEWRTIHKAYPEGLDLRQTPLISVGAITVGGGQSAEYYLRLTLRNGNKEYQCIAPVMPTAWDIAIFDLAKCPFLGNIRDIEIGMMNNSDSLWRYGYHIDGLIAGRPIDLTFNIAGSERAFTSQGGTIGRGDGALLFGFNKGNVLCSPSLKGSRNSIYNPPLEHYNTMFCVIENHSTASRLKLSFITSDDTVYDDLKSKIFTIQPNAAKRGYYFNLSDLTTARGSLQGFRIEPLDGRGKMLIDRISFEDEEPLNTYGGRIDSCMAVNGKVIVRGSIHSQYLNAYDTLAIYDAPMYKSSQDLSGLKLLYEGPLTEHFNIQSIDLAATDGRRTLLSSRMMAIIRHGDQWMRVAPYFYINNWRDYSKNPYAFTLPSYRVSVLDFGAKGDGFTNDTRAIQAAIDKVAAQGGGTVVLTGDTSRYGRRYVATHLMLRSNIELHLEPGAILWQSEEERDYDYRPFYGHDVVIPNTPWTHSLFSNYPLIQALDVNNIKITGGGKIRMADRYCEDRHIDHYARHCSDRIHIVPLGFFNVQNIELTDFDIVRSNNYHTHFDYCSNMFVGNLRLHEVKCVSGDGISLANGTNHVRVDRIFFESNDDGIVLSNSYGDKRGGVWKWDRKDWNHSVHHIEVCHSYICSGPGAGKAIAIIPWGTTNPDQQHQQLYDIRVYDCTLIGGYSVGTWPDNPFDGKPFDNTATDDYAPVYNFTITNNHYVSPCDLLCIRPTNFITDCGIHSSSTFQNGDFRFGHCYWTCEGDADAENGYGYTKGGRIYEGLYLTPGHYQLICEVQGNGSLFNTALTASPADPIIKTFDTKDWTLQQIDFEVTLDGDYRLGIAGPDARIRKVVLKQ